MGSEILKTDVFIVGGGPAGLATGIAIRQRGLRVIVADHARPPIDKPCGEGLMPRTVAELKTLGVTFGPAQGIPFRGIRFIGEGRVAGGVFPRVTDWEFAGLRCTKPSWTDLRMRAWNAYGESCVRRIDRGEIWLDSGKVQSRWIIGADGQNSRVRKWAGLDRGSPREARIGFRQHFRVAPWTDFVEIHWGRRCQIVVTPVSTEEVCLVLTSRSPRLRHERGSQRFPGTRSKTGRESGRHQGYGRSFNLAQSPPRLAWVFRAGR